MTWGHFYLQVFHCNSDSTEIAYWHHSNYDIMITTKCCISHNSQVIKCGIKFQFDLRYEKIVPNYTKKIFFMMMTSSMTSQGGLKTGPLYSFINEITTFFMITKKRAKISSLNFLCIGIMRLWLKLYKYVFMTSFMTSPVHKIGQILKFIYLRQY